MRIRSSNAGSVRLATSRTGPPQRAQRVSHVEGILKQLGERRIHLKPRWPGIHGPEPETTGDGEEEEILDPFRIELPTLLVVNKADLTEDAEEELGVLQELLGLEFPHELVSAETGEGCEQVSEFLFRGLEIIRVYTKAPGKPANDDRPFTLRRGQTVIDVAQQLHKDIASSLRYARVWGTEVYAGQRVGPEHKLADRDILELHMR